MFPYHCGWLADGVRKRKWDENPAQMWAGVLLKASARFGVLKDI